MKLLLTGFQQTLVQITNELRHLAIGAGRCCTRADSYAYAHSNADPYTDTNPDSYTNSYSYTYPNTDSDPNPNA